MDQHANDKGRRDDAVTAGGPLEIRYLADLGRHRGDWRALLYRAGPAGGVGVAEVRARAALRRICGIRKGVTARGRSLLWGRVKVPSRLS